MSLTYDVYNEPSLGHSRVANGSFIFGPLHDDPDAQVPVGQQTMTSPFDFFASFAMTIIDSIQTRKFPYDLLRRMMRNRHDESEVVAYQTNIIVTCVVALLIMVGIIIFAIVYTVRRWRDRKRNRYLLKKQLFDQRRGRIIIFIGFFMAVFNIVFLLLSLMSASSTLTAVEEMDKDVTQGMDGVSGYFNHSGEQWDFMSNDTNIWSLISVLQSDVADIGTIVWQPGVQGYSANLNSPFAKTANLDDELSLAVTYLNDMQNQINTIIAGSLGNDLTAFMSEIYYNLTQARNDYSCVDACSGTCNGCSDIIVDDIYYNMDFTTLTDVTSNLQALQTLTATKVANTLRNPEYYFWRGIGDVIEANSNVSGAMTGLNSSLGAYSNSIGGSTSNIRTPNETDLKFDSFRSEWKTWYDSVKGQEAARYAFHIIFSGVNIVMLAFLYFGWALLVLPGLVKLKPEDDLFKLPRRIILICLIVSLGVATCLLVIAVVGFYAGANVYKVVCEPTENKSIIQNTVDYSGGVPGHDGLYLSSIMLGNGTLYPLYVADTLDECRANNTTSYNVFRQDIAVPNIYTDLQYAPFFVNLTSYFDAMLISLDNVTLVPPLLEDWYSNFTSAAFFNLTEYVEFLGKSAINANLTTYVNNILTIQNYTYPQGPFEPAKSRLYDIAQKLLGQESSLTQMNNLKSSVSTVFYQYKNLIENIQSNITSAMAALRSHEPTVQSLSASYIASGVGLHKTNFEDQLYSVQNTSQTWITEIGPCSPLPYSYDVVYDTFCNKYSDNLNATWLLLGTAVFFCLLVALTSFLLFREIPQVDVDDQQEALDIKKEFPQIFGHKTGCCCCCCIPCCCGSHRKYKKKKQRAESIPQSPAQHPVETQPQASTVGNKMDAFTVRGQPPETTRKRF